MDSPQTPHSENSYDSTGIKPQHCLNCNTSLQTNAKYCTNCGQGTHESRLSVWYIVGEAFSNFFNLDGRFFSTIKNLHRPAKLARAYVEGQRRSYMNPAKLFIFSLLALISIVMLDIHLEDASLVSYDLREEVALAKVKRGWDTTYVKYANGTEADLIKGIEKDLFRGQDLDSMFLGDRSTATVLGKSINDYSIKKVDALNLSSEKLLEKYEIEGFWDRLFVKQYLKVLNNASGGINYAIKNFTWVLLLLIFAMAVLLKVLYIRNNYYYVEHLVLLMYSHASLFILVSLFLLVAYLLKGTSFPIGLAIGVLALGVLITQYLTIKNYYQQGKLMTALYMFIINVSYLFMAIIIVTFGTLLSFIIF